MNKVLAAKRAYLKRENAGYGREMETVHRPYPPHKGGEVEGVWRSADYLVQIVREGNSGLLRISVNRTMVQRTGDDWLDGISWDELQRVKREIGFGDRLCVEIYPRHKDIVNIANIRHLFVMPEDFRLGWENR